jgi:hypothetical protein
MGHMDLKIGIEGFFTTIFHNHADKDQIFENGTYFFRFVGLHLRYWTGKFNLDKEYFSYAPIWVHLCSLSHVYWEEEILAVSGNTLGTFVKIDKATKKGRYTTHTII